VSPKSSSIQIRFALCNLVPPLLIWIAGTLVQRQAPPAEGFLLLGPCFLLATVITEEPEDFYSLCYLQLYLGFSFYLGFSLPFAHTSQPL